MKRTEKTDKILVKYRQYLKLEKSLSDNTVDAYLTDLDKLLAYLTLENINILDVRLENLEDFSAGLHDIGIHPRSQARILSGIRSFLPFPHYGRLPESRPDRIAGIPPDRFQTARSNDCRRDRPADRKHRPQHQRGTAQQGHTGNALQLRAPRFRTLQPEIIRTYFEEGFIKVEGKGSKQRLVPISPRAIKEIRLYFTDRNLMKIKPGFEDFVFISNFGKNISRIMVFHIIKELAARIGLKKKSVLTLPPFFCNTFAGRRRQLACHTVYAGT